MKTLDIAGRVAATFTPATSTQPTENELRTWANRHPESFQGDTAVYPQAYSGALITVDGVDGTGKTSLVQALAQHPLLKDRFDSAVSLRQPGGSTYAEKVRDIARQDPISPYTQTLIFMSAIRDSWERSISPALADHGLVVTDRLYTTTMAYQGVQSGQADLVTAILENTPGYRHPDITIYLTTNLQVSLDRLAKERGMDDDRWGQSAITSKEISKEAFDFLHFQERKTNHLADKLGYLEHIRETFWSINNSVTPYWHRPANILAIDANQAPEAILKQAVQAILALPSFTTSH